MFFGSVDDGQSVFTFAWFPGGSGRPDIPHPLRPNGPDPVLDHAGLDGKRIRSGRTMPWRTKLSA